MVHDARFLIRGQLETVNVGLDVVQQLMGITVTVHSIHFRRYLRLYELSALSPQFGLIGPARFAHI
jgi:hypothetical protein